MSKQNKMSIKQVIKNEYKSIGFFALIVLLFPLISEGILLADLTRFNNLQPLQKLATLIGVGDFSFTNTQFLSYFTIIVTIIAVPLLALVMARKLNGQRLLHSIRDGFQDFGSKRSWNYILKVYLPYILVIVVLVVIMSLIPATTLLNLASSLMESTALAIVVLILVLILSVVISSIAGVLFVGNVVYMRGAPRIKAVFKAIPNRETNKILIFNLVEILVLVVIIGCFAVPVMSMQPLSLLTKAVSIMIGFLIVIIIYQILFMYLRFSLYMNVASKVEVKNSKNISVKAVRKNKAIETNTSSDELSLETKEVEVAEVNAEKADFEQATEEVVSEEQPAQEVKAFESKIQPKAAKRKNRINPNDTEEVNVKPKRSIK